MFRKYPILLIFLALFSLFAFSAVAFAHGVDQPPDPAAAGEVQVAALTGPNVITAPCAGGPVIDGITLDECVVRNFNVGPDPKSVTVWYTKITVTATRTIDGNPVTMRHWIDTDAQAQQVAQWFEQAWQRYHTDSGHHLYDNGCSNNLNVRMEQGVGWSGIAYWASAGNCWIGIDSGTIRAGGGQWTVYHEAQHYLQYSFDSGCYDYLRPNYPDDSEFVEGYADLGADTVDAVLDASGYAGSTYNPDTSMYDKSYGNIFNKYFIEQLGTVGTPANPWHHIDALYNHYRECDTQNTLYVLDSLIPSLSGGKWNINQFFLNFFAANWSKDWADAATQPELVYTDDDASPYGNLAPLTQDVSIAGGVQSWSDATPDDWAARYYQVRPQAGCPYVQAEVNGASGAQLGINFMAADTSAPTRVLRSAKIGEDYIRTFAGAGVNDRIVAVVNSFGNNYNYNVSFTCVSPTLDIKEPRQVRIAMVGSPASPIAYLARWTVTDGASNVRGLLESSFTFRAGADPVTVVAGSFQEVGDEYWAILLPPVKPAGTTFVDFTACLDTICDTETNALLYVDPGDSDIALSFDASGSMTTEDVIGEGTRLSNAQKAGKVVADLLHPGDRIVVLDWSGKDQPAGCGLPPDGSGSGNCLFDPRLLLSRRDVTTPTLTTDINNARSAIDGITAREWTPVGSGIQDAKNKLLAAPFSLNPKHIFLLSDGRENVHPLYSEIKTEVVDSGVVVNTIGLGPEAPGNLLAQIAADTNGIYRPVPTTATGTGMVSAASTNATSALNAPSDIEEALATPFLPGQLGLADTYDYFDTKAQGAARIFGANYTNVPAFDAVGSRKELTINIDKSVNEMRLVVAGKQPDDDNLSCTNSDARKVEVLLPGMDPQKDRWIPISPRTGATPPEWDIRNNRFDDVLVVTNPAEGAWRFRTYYFALNCIPRQANSQDAPNAPTNGGPYDFLMNVSVQSTIQLEGRFLGLNANQGNAGDVVSIVGTLLTRDGTIPGATVLVLIDSLRGTDTLVLKDDGLHGDGAANDGIYAAPFVNTTVGGSYSVRMLAVFKDPANPANNLIREWDNGFWINGPRPEQKCDQENDKDCDGMPDKWELRCKLDITRNDANEDLDKDGLTNVQEFQAGTLPCRADTDHGGEKDGSEVNHGRNPLDAKDDRVRPIGHINVRPLNKLILIDWTTPLSYTNMLLYISTDINDIGKPISMGQSNNFTVENVLNDQTYYVRLSGVISDTEGDYSDPIAVTPKADPDAPAGAMVINGGAETTPAKQVVLNVSSTDTPLEGAAESANAHQTDRFSLLYNEVSAGVEMRFSNSSDMAGATWEPLASTKPWTLACADGETCRVYAQFRDAAKNESLIIDDFIVLHEQQATDQHIFLPLINK
ncbi:MAG: hypothetical protein NT075_05340 [Chloroflexi bacterium]|nr:hypothetical protein [Chloroflexota bacterium]